ncbi:MAG: hypothetical protein KGO94_05530 [Alphaproteobacteria bacterium]|nr:hypothetical protein [Alphaproteobacteria bacterium]
MKSFIRLAALLGICTYAAPAWSSADTGFCSPNMQVFYNSMTGCDSMALLSPANDTRINLVFLLADARRQKLKQFPPQRSGNFPDLTYTPTNWTRFSSALDFGQKQRDPTDGSSYVGEGTVCVSLGKGAEGFIAAVTADTTIPEPEKTALAAARKAMTCEAAATPLTDVASASGKEFAAYLSAIDHFYHANHFYSADFAALAQSPQAWVREAARYMQARTALLDAQSTAFDDYGTLDKKGVVPAKVTTALLGLNAYLKDYPQGAYAASAKGLLRRAYWLSGDGVQQIKAYAETIATHDLDPAVMDVINEFDQKVDAGAYQDPASDQLFVATELLRQMRPKRDENGRDTPTIKASDVQAQHERFAGNEKLYTYLQAAQAWFSEQDAGTVLKLLPVADTGTDALSYLDYSMQMLRAGALAKTDMKAARAAYVSLIGRSTQAFQRGPIELAVSMIDERTKNISAVFAPDTIVQEPALRQRVLEYIAGPILLRQQAMSTTAPKEERNVALFRLLSRDVLQGRIKGFLDDIKLLPPVPAADADGSVNDIFEPFRWKGGSKDFACANLVETVKSLVEDAKSRAGRLCLGDFIRITAISNPEKAKVDELGGTGTLFAGTPVARQDFYIDIINDAKATREQRAYALFRAVHCYAPIGNNDCGGTDVSIAQRKKWYFELKARYPETKYAKELQYFW